MFHYFTLFCFLLRHAQLADILPRDLVQGTEPLIVIGATEAQPVVRAGIGQIRRSDGFEILDLRPSTGDTCDTE